MNVILDWFESVSGFTTLIIISIKVGPLGPTLEYITEVVELKYPIL
jgi:hypothetical protein